MAEAGLQRARALKTGTAFEQWRERNLPALMLLPAVAILAGLTLFPTVYLFSVAFQKFNPDVNVENEFVGLENFSRLLTDMEDTLHDYGGVGLAAPQINEDWRVAVIEIGARPSRYGDLDPMPFTVFVNPVIDVLSPQPVAGFWEGCLSVPGLRGYVERPQHVRVRYTDLDGKAQSVDLQGFGATVFQHEFDHLDGTLYVDRVARPELLMFEEELGRFSEEWAERVAQIGPADSQRRNI